MKRWWKKRKELAKKYGIPLVRRAKSPFLIRVIDQRSGETKSFAFPRYAYEEKKLLKRLKEVEIEFETSPFTFLKDEKKEVTKLAYLIRKLLLKELKSDT